MFKSMSCINVTKYSNLKKTKSLNDLYSIVQEIIDDDNWSLSYFFE